MDSGRATRRQARAGGSGLSLAAHLVALGIVPTVAMVTLLAVLSSQELAQAHQAGRVVAELKTVSQIDSARIAVEHELMPTVLSALLRDSRTGSAVFTDPTSRELLLVQTPTDLLISRDATDRAFSSVPASSSATPVLTAVAAQLTAARAGAVDPAVPVADVAGDYLAVVDRLVSAERHAIITASSGDRSAASVRANSDALLVAQLAQASSARLPLLLSAHLSMPAAGASASSVSSARAAAIANWSQYQVLRDRVGALPEPSLRRRWARIAAAGATHFDAKIAAMTLGDAQGLPASSIIDLEVAGAQRDSDLAGLQRHALSVSERAAARDRTLTEHHLALLLALGALALLGSAVAAVAVGLTASRSLLRLAAAAQQISEGELVDVPERGPREVRTVARALAGAVEGLRRTREQAQAVARGDLSDPVLAHPQSGPLGAVIHASVQRIVDAMRAREQLQGELAHAATHDPLTSLPHRAQIVRLAQAALARGGRGGTPTGLLHLDLDHFKAVNDTLGQACGDEVLRVVAARMAEVVRAGDVVGRLGGDEFVVLVGGSQRAYDLVQLAQRLIDAVSEPIPWRGASAVVGACVGIAMDVDAGSDVEALFHEADIALARARSSGRTHGRGQVELFDEAMREELAAHAAMEEDLRAAVASGGLELAFQPVVAPATGELDGFEALARWERPGTGRVPPDVFIPVAEASDLVNDLGRWALLEATARLAEWTAARGAGARLLRVGVNVSGRHIVDPRVLLDVTDALAASGLHPSQLTVEITETVLVDDPAAGEHLRALREMGCVVAIDDFGTGFTSLGQIGRMPADILKIDRSFVSSDAPGDRAVGALAMAAAHTVGMTVIAEGAETREQVERLVANDCELVQGYYFSRPLPVDEAAALACGSELPWTSVPRTSVPGDDHGKSIQPDVTAQV